MENTRNYLKYMVPENTQQNDSNESFAIVGYKNEIKTQMILICQISIKVVFQQVEICYSVLITSYGLLIQTLYLEKLKMVMVGNI